VIIIYKCDCVIVRTVTNYKIILQSSDKSLGKRGGGGREGERERERERERETRSCTLLKYSFRTT